VVEALGVSPAVLGRPLGRTQHGRYRRRAWARAFEAHLRALPLPALPPAWSTVALAGQGPRAPSRGLAWPLPDWAPTGELASPTRAATEEAPWSLPIEEEQRCALAYLLTCYAERTPRAGRLFHLTLMSGDPRFIEEAFSICDPRRFLAEHALVGGRVVDWLGQLGVGGDPRAWARIDREAA